MRRIVHSFVSLKIMFVMTETEEARNVDGVSLDPSLGRVEPHPHPLEAAIVKAEASCF